MIGVSSQATNSSFWNDTNGATEGVLYQAVSGPGVAVTPKTLPFVAAFNKRFGNNPSYCGYTAYDEVYYIADAIKRGGRPIPTSWSTRWKRPNTSARSARVEFKGKDTANPHALKIGGTTHPRPDAAMAGRQAGQSVAGQRRQRQDEIPEIHQARLGQLMRE